MSSILKVGYVACVGFGIHACEDVLHGDFKVQCVSRAFFGGEVQSVGQIMRVKGTGLK